MNSCQLTSMLHDFNIENYIYWSNSGISLLLYFKGRAVHPLNPILDVKDNSRISLDIYNSYT